MALLACSIMKRFVRYFVPSYKKKGGGESHATRPLFKCILLRAQHPFIAKWHSYFIVSVYTHCLRNSTVEAGKTLYFYYTGIQ